MRILLLNILSLTIISCLGADPKYPVSSIPDELKKDVNVVVREDKMVYTINSISTATSYAHFVVTILNGQGNDFAYKAVGYDKLSKITKFKANVYDAAGTLIKKLKSSEFVDRSSFDGFSLFSDNRYKSADLTQGTYPYTVEFEYEVEFKFLYSIDGTNLIPGERASVQHASYQLIFPSDLAPRYKVLNIQGEPVKSKTENGLELLTWTFENLKPIKFEPYGPNQSELIPKIIAAPSAFEYEGYKGDMSTWESYGKWEGLLLKGRDELPESTKLKIREMTKGLTTNEEKTKKLYEYLQSKTRYVSIQLGIGGLQPFEASVVDNVGYGDCKALSNYMVAILNEAGIKGYYSSVLAGDFKYDLILDFPSHQLNHVVVAVPNGTDTLWLECTNQTNPFGYSGMFTGDRKAFMITENGGVWVNTPRYSAEQNVQSRAADVVVKITGEAIAKVKTVYAGLQYETNDLNFFLNGQYDLQKKWILENTDIPNFELSSFTIENKKDKVPSAIVNLNLNLKRYATVSGKRIVFTANLMNRNSFVPEKTSERKTTIVRNFGFTDYDTIRYHIPEEFYMESLPQPLKLTSMFGEYESSYSVDHGMVVYTRKLKIYKGKYTPGAYQEFMDFYKMINRADNAKLIFLDKT